MAIPIATLVVKVNGDTTDFTTKMLGASKTLNRFATNATAVAASFHKAGATMLRSLTLPLALLGGFGVKQFASFDNAMTQSLAIMTNVTTQMRKQMEGVAKSLSEMSTFAAKDLAKSYFFLASAGLDVKQSIAALPQVTQFAQAGMFDLSRATSLLAGSQAALGLKVKDATKNLANMSRISDVLVKANQLSDATTEQFGEALTRAGGGMKAFGVELEEGVAVLAAYAEIQRKGEVGGEAFSRVLRLLIPAANKNAAAYSRLGIEVFDVAGNLRNFGLILKDLETAFTGMSARQISASLEMLGFQRRMQGAILPLIGMSDNIAEFETRLGKAGGTTGSVARNQLKSFTAQMTLAWHEIQNASKVLGEELAPRLLEIVKGTADAAKGFATMNKGVQNLIINAGLFLLVLGPLVLLIGKLIGAFAFLTSGAAKAAAGIAWLVTKQAEAITATAAVTAATAAEGVAIRTSVAARLASIVAQQKATASTINHLSALSLVSRVRLVDIGLITKETTATTALVQVKKSEVAAQLAAANAIKATSAARTAAIGLAATQLIAVTAAVAGVVAFVKFVKVLVSLRKESDRLATSMDDVARKNQELKDKFGVGLGGLRALRESMHKEAQVAATATAAVTPQVFMPGESDIEASLAFHKKQNDFLLDSMKLEEQVNQLLRDRMDLEIEAERLRKTGLDQSKEFFDVRSGILDIDEKLGDVAAARISEIVDAAKKQQEATRPRFTAAAEEGSLAAFRLRIGATKDPVLKVNEEQKKELQKLTQLTAEQTDLLESGIKLDQTETVVVLP